MLHKRRFGKKGFVAVLACVDAVKDSELMGRIDGAALQFGITHDYELTFCLSAHTNQRRQLYIDFMEKSFALLDAGYIAIITVGPEAHTAFHFAAAQMGKDPMLIAVNGQDALDSNAPHQYEMRSPHPMFSAGLSNLVQTCLKKNITQEEGVEYFREYESERQNRDWGLFDDCYVQVMNRNRVAVTVRFEDEDDTIIETAADKPFMGRDRTILFQA